MMRESIVSFNGFRVGDIIVVIKDVYFYDASSIESLYLKKGLTGTIVNFVSLLDDILIHIKIGNTIFEVTLKESDNHIQSLDKFREETINNILNG